MYGQNATKLQLRDLSTGEYEFQLVVYDAEGQQDADTVKVTVAGNIADTGHMSCNL